MTLLKNAAALASTTALVLALTACAGADPDSSPSADATPIAGGELVVASLPATINPYTTTSRSNWMVAASVCEGLFANAANTAVNNGLAEDFTYDEEAGEYLIDIRPDVNLHSGGTLTAQDVVASLVRYSEGNAGTLFARLVDSVEVVDELTVSIQTVSPTGAIPALLATPDTGAYIMSAASLEAAGDGEVTTLDCTGPYTLESFAVDQEAVVSRFADYSSRDEESDGAAGAKVAYADTIRFIPLNEDNIINQLRTGQVSVAPQFVSMDQLAVYESDPDLTPIVAEGSQFSLLQFNLQQGPFVDLALREAVMNAVDTEEIALQNLGGLDYFQDISSMFPPDSPWYSEAGSEIWESRDPQRAQELLAEAGYDGTPVRVLYRPTSDTYGPLLQQQLENAGFTVELMAVDSATFGTTRTDPGAWDLFLAGGTAYSDPLTVVFLNDDFPGWWTTDEKTALVEELTAGATLEERKPSWDKLQQMIWDYLPFVKLGHEPRLVVTSADVAGLKPTQGTVQGFYNVWIRE
jgi:peptide/nickel transport system substrate-binding protein